ncbi:MAG TPA: hypothetical protein VG674_24335 [Amycolatopsis sp.]|nr:hypothetical protein [Amycolatopsis sp.]
MTPHGITRATPLPSLVKMRPEKWQIARMSRHDKVISTCQYCRTLYRNAGAANLCEHWHHPIPALR